MSDEIPQSDSWQPSVPEDAFEDEAFEAEEEAYYESAPAAEPDGQDWDDVEGYDDAAYYDEDDGDVIGAGADDVDASFYEPPQPPITDAELEDEPPEEDENWWRVYGWRLAVIVILVILILFFLLRACGGKGKEQSPAPLPTTLVQPTSPVSTTPEIQVTATLQSGAPVGAPLETTPAAPAQPVATIAPTVAPTAPPAPAGKFSIGDTVVVTGTGVDRLAFRSGPGRNYEIQRTIKDGVKLVVIGGPEKSGGFTWWQLKTPKGYVGWAVEDYLRPLQ